MPISSVTLTTDNHYRPRIGGGHHYLKLFVNISGHGGSSILKLFINGAAFGTCVASFSLNLQHTCGGSGYVIKIEEWDSSDTTLISDFTCPPEVLCSTEDLFMAQDPIVTSCNITAGVNKPVTLTSIPAVAGYTVTAYLDGDDTYTPVASGVTDGSGNVTVTIPNAVNGQKYRFTQIGNGFRESFGSNWVLIGAGCYNFTISPVLTCSGLTPSVTFNPQGGSGNYSYSFDNNDSTGYFPYTALTSIPLTNNTTYTIHIRDNSTLNKIVYSVVTDCGGLPTPTPVPVPIPTPSPVPTPVSCNCRQGVIDTNAAYNYTNCIGVLQTGTDSQGVNVCYDADESKTNVTDLGLSAGCNCEGGAPLYIYNLTRCTVGTPLFKKGSYPFNVFPAGTVVLGSDGVCYVSLGHSSSLDADITIVTNFDNCSTCAGTPPTPVTPPTPIPLPIPFVQIILWEFIFTGETCSELAEFSQYSISSVYTNNLGVVLGNLAYIDEGLTTFLPDGFYCKFDKSLCIQIKNGQIIFRD